MTVTALDCKVTLVVHRRSAWPQIEPVWAELVEAATYSSFFLTTAWVGTWLEIYGEQLDPSIVVFEHNGQAVGACLIVNPKPRLSFLPVKRISLNTSSEPVTDTPYAEFNDLLCRAGWEEFVAEALCRHLADLDWDELALDGFQHGTAYAALKHAFGKLDWEELEHSSYYVDLAALRASGRTFEQSLGSTHRKHLRQNIRHYAKDGPVRIDCATDVPTALAMLRQLAELSQKRFTSLGRSCIFSSTSFVSFHHRLIAKCFHDRAIQMCHVAAGDQTIGVVYNLVHKGKVYFYQCGYQYGSDRRWSPGTLTLFQTIQWCLDAGFDDYDFLSGESRYKRWLSTSSRILLWTVFRRPGLRLRLFQRLREIKSQLTPSS